MRELGTVVVLALAACASERELPDASPVAGVHPAGFADEHSPSFHVFKIVELGYDLAICAECHGSDFAGGASQVSCLRCHPSGPDACTTCHRDGPTSGVHTRHRAAGQGCEQCHVVPARWDAEGHVRRNGAADLPPAEVTFGALANASLDPADRDGPATYDAGTCTNVYCHGSVLHAGGGSATAPRWDATPVGGCTSCHGAPPPSHAQAECTSCHKNAPHIDGVLEVGSDCNGCHRTTPVFASLAGSTLTVDPRVGAHQAHLTGASRLRGPIACEECHQVPAQITSPGHLDSLLPAEVFPAGAGVLARADGAAPAWDHDTASCAGSYCHGGGAALAADTSPGLLRTPVWNAGDQTFCGSCHGIPPSTHSQALTVRDCATCHPSVDAFGNPVFDLAGASRHLDGVIDVL